MYLSRTQENKTSAKPKQKHTRTHSREGACSPNLDLKLSYSTWCIFTWQSLSFLPSSAWIISLPLCEVWFCVGTGGTPHRRILKLPIQFGLPSLVVIAQIYREVVKHEIFKLHLEKQIKLFCCEKNILLCPYSAVKAVAQYKEHVGYRFCETSAVLARLSVIACLREHLLHVCNKVTKCRCVRNTWCGSYHWFTDVQRGCMDISHFRSHLCLCSGGHLEHVWFWVSLRLCWILTTLSLIFCFCLHRSVLRWLFSQCVSHCWVFNTSVTSAGAVGDGRRLDLC